MTSGLSGRVGHLLVAVRGPAAPGEVELVVDGTCETYIAYGTERVARGELARPDIEGAEPEE